MSADRVLDILEAAEALVEGSAADSPSGAVRDYWRHQGGKRLLWEDALPPRMASLLRNPARALFPTDFDAKENLQYAWLSSPGMRTHTHFDNDRNFFVQLIGEKRFVLWHPNQTSELCPYPRLHPLWHKSRVDFEAPDLRPRPCANYSQTEALTVTVRPGDVLYIPPFYWHTVETLRPSLSLSTLSRWPQLYNHANALYSHDYLFDILLHPRSRGYAMRAFLMQLMTKSGDKGIVARVSRRYEGFEGLFEDELPLAAPGEVEAANDTESPGQASRAPTDLPRRCALDSRGTPMARWALSQINFDVNLVWEEHLLKLPAAVRETVMIEWIEEMIVEAIGASEVWPFLRDCFNAKHRMPFFLTVKGTEEHKRLWTTKDK